MWLYLPPSCRSAPVEEDLTSASDSLFQTLEQSATWKTKSRHAVSWRRTWSRNYWLPLLFGQTYEPSTAQRGVAKWISSLADTPASRSATQGSDSAPRIPGICGLPSQPSSETLNPSGASSRTSALICDSDSVKSPETFKVWATGLRRSCLQRRKLARLTAANASSSWPTARASYNENRNTQPAPSHGVTHGKTLSGEAIRAMRNWQTPNAAAEAPNLGSNIKNGPKPLLAQAEQTTRAPWQTPSANEDAAGTLNGNMQHMLSHQVQEWAYGEKQVNLPTGAHSSGRPVPTTVRDGLASSLPDDWTSSRLRLNPKFVSWLMGWPEDWADPISSLAPTNSTSSVTG